MKILLHVLGKYFSHAKLLLKTKKKHKLRLDRGCKVKYYFYYKSNISLNFPETHTCKKA